MPDINVAETRMQAQLRDGVTTREQVLLKLGTPSAEFENGRIMTYLMTVTIANEMIALPRQQASTIQQTSTRWQGVTHNLVLVFRSDGVLEKHSLLKTTH